MAKTFIKNIFIPLSIREKLEELAKADGRKLSAYITYLLVRASQDTFPNLVNVYQKQRQMEKDFKEMQLEIDRLKILVGRLNQKIK